MKQINQGVEAARERMNKLLQDEPWIRAEEQFFGKAGMQYDFQELEPHALQKEIEEMEVEKDDLKRRFDPKVEELAQKNQEMYD